MRKMPLHEKTKVLISCAVTAQLICGFVFVYANCLFSHAVAQISLIFFQLTSYGGELKYTVFYDIEGQRQSSTTDSDVIITVSLLFCYV